MTGMPFGAGTLVIPFDRSGGTVPLRGSAGMSRMRPAGELFRSGVMRTAVNGAEEEGQSAERAEQS